MQKKHSWPKQTRQWRDLHCDKCPFTVPRFSPLVWNSWSKLIKCSPALNTFVVEIYHARRRHARGEGAPTWKAPENRFPPPTQLPGSHCVICQKFWQKTTDLAQTKQAAKKRCTFYLRSKYICYKDQLGYLIIERWSNKLMVNTQL